MEDVLFLDRFGNPESAYQFDGLNDYIKVIENNFDINSCLTIAAWANTSSSKHDQMILERSGWNSGEYGLLINEWPTYTGRGRFQVFQTSPKYLNTNNPINNGEWCFLVRTWSDFDLFRRIFVGGCPIHFDVVTPEAYGGPIAYSNVPVVCPINYSTITPPRGMLFSVE